MARRKGILILLGALFALILVLGGTAAMAQATNLPDSPIRDTVALAYQGEGDTDSPNQDGEGDAHFPGHHGFGRQLEGITPMDELLAAELGISVEALNDALAEAHAAAREQAEQRGSEFRDPHHGSGEAFLTLLAEKLGKSVDELQAAQAAAKSAFLAELVDAGVVTQEQIDMMEARRALGETIDPEALLAEALGIELAELQAARDAGTSLRELLGDTSMEDFAAAYKAAYEAAVLQAAANGVITDAQAEEILSGDFGFGHGFGFSHRFGHGQGLGRHHFGGTDGYRGFGQGQSSPETTGTSL